MAMTGNPNEYKGFSPWIFLSNLFVGRDEVWRIKQPKAMRASLILRKKILAEDTGLLVNV